MLTPGSSYNVRMSPNCLANFGMVFNSLATAYRNQKFMIVFELELGTNLRNLKSQTIYSFIVLLNLSRSVLK